MNKVFETNKNAMIITKSSKYFVLAKIVTVITLALFFIFFSNVTFLHYWDGKKITSSSVSTSESGKLLLPAIIICREIAYNKQTEMYKLEDFLNNTMDLVYYVDDENYMPIESNSTLLKRESVYSLNRGNCYVLKYLKEVNNLKYEKNFVHSF